MVSIFREHSFLLHSKSIKWLQEFSFQNKGNTVEGLRKNYLLGNIIIPRFDIAKTFTGRNPGPVQSYSHPCRLLSVRSSILYYLNSSSSIFPWLFSRNKLCTQSFLPPGCVSSQSVLDYCSALWNHTLPNTPLKVRHHQHQHYFDTLIIYLVKVGIKLDNLWAIVKHRTFLPYGCLQHIVTCML
jgi:hypothetical protein